MQAILRELLTIAACLIHNNKRKPDIQEEESRMSINLPHVERTIEKLRHILKSHKIRPTFCTDRLCVNSYLNREIE